MVIYLGLPVALPEASWEDCRHSRLNPFGTISPLGDITGAKEKPVGKPKGEWLLDNVLHTNVYTERDTHICSCGQIPEPREDLACEHLFM